MSEQIKLPVRFGLGLLQDADGENIGVFRSTVFGRYTNADLNALGKQIADALNATREPVGADVTDLEAFRILKRRLPYGKSKLDQEVNLAHAWNFAREYFTRHAAERERALVEALDEIHKVASAGCPVGECPDATFKAISDICAEVKL